MIMASHDWIVQHEQQKANHPDFRFSPVYLMACARSKHKGYSSILIKRTKKWLHVGARWCIGPRWRGQKRGFLILTGSGILCMVHQKYPEMSRKKGVRKVVHHRFRGVCIWT